MVGGTASRPHGGTRPAPSVTPTSAGGPPPGRPAATGGFNSADPVAPGPPVPVASRTTSDTAGGRRDRPARAPHRPVRAPHAHPRRTPGRTGDLGFPRRPGEVRGGVRRGRPR